MSVDISKIYEVAPGGAVHAKLVWIETPEIVLPGEVKTGADNVVNEEAVEKALDPIMFVARTLQ